MLMEPSLERPTKTALSRLAEEKQEKICSEQRHGLDPIPYLELELSQ